MGRRKNRKMERRRQQSQGGGVDWGWREPVAIDPEVVAFGPPDDILAAFPMLDETWRAQVAQKACGNCREFVEDQEGGRGTCLHPGSGIVAPWTDTKACDFYHRRR
jgi:hypothetical protein